MFPIFGTILRLFGSARHSRYSRTTMHCASYTTYMQCGTPGCNLIDFHRGAHSNERVDSKRTRKTSDTQCDKRTVDTHGNSGYGGMCKAGQREMFARAAKESDSPVMYLDGPDAALTVLLLKRDVPAERLVPVNKEVVVARAIESICPEVKCRVDDICIIAAAAEFHEYGAVWFDMCSVDFGTFAVSALVTCAELKFFTLSSRQLLCVDQQTVLCNTLVANHEKIVEQSLYTGISGKAMNMVFVVCKSSGTNKKRCTSGTESDEGLSGDRIAIGTVVRIPLSYWKSDAFLRQYNFKVFFGGFLVGAVHSRVTNSGSEFWLSFQCDDKTTMRCARKYPRSAIVRYAI